MKIISVKKLKISEIIVIKFERFSDHRGYFTETYRKSNLLSDKTLKNIFSRKLFVQANESFSLKRTLRGLHFQWSPFMGKLVRTIHGRMVDMALDIRKNSPNYGKIILYDMPSKSTDNYGEWIWIPPGFAHGNFFTENTTIEYFCTGEYSPGNEAAISPLAIDINWSLCSRKLKNEFLNFTKSKMIITDKDRGSFSVNEWSGNPESKNFIYSRTQVI